MYGGQSAEKNCKGECQCEPHFARLFTPRYGTQRVEKSDRGITDQRIEIKAASTRSVSDGSHSLNTAKYGNKAALFLSPALFHESLTSVG